MVARTDIISIELVNPYECTGCSEPEGPGQERTQDRELAFMHVVGEGGIELFFFFRSKTDPGSVSDYPGTGYVKTKSQVGNDVPEP